MSKGIGWEFFGKTKYKYLGTSKQQKGITPPALQENFDRSGEKFDLPDPNKIDSAIKKLINHRSSIREYQDAAISKDELSYLLWCTQGVKEKVGNIHTLRTGPSAGARHALETFILVNKVDGLTPGWPSSLGTQVPDHLCSLSISLSICSSATSRMVKRSLLYISPL